MARRLSVAVRDPARSLAAPARAEDEAPGPADLKITVVDQTGAALITASVTIADAAGTPRIVKVDERGQAVVPGLGSRHLHGARRGRGVSDVRRAADAEEGRQRGDRQPAAGRARRGSRRPDRQRRDVAGNAFTSSLSEQQIAELPDDPDELEQVLMQMAGPGATMRVNGFRGGRLPPKNADPVDPVPHELLRRRQPRGRRRLRHRHRHQARHGRLARDDQLRLPRRVAERAQRVCADAGRRAVPAVRHQPRRPAGQGQDLAGDQPRRQRQLRQPDDQRQHAVWHRTPTSCGGPTIGCSGRCASITS